MALRHVRRALLVDSALGQKTSQSAWRHRDREEAPKGEALLDGIAESLCLNREGRRELVTCSPCLVP